MAEMYFKVAADYQEVQRLRQEVENLENKLKSFTPGTSKDVLAHYQRQLSDTRSKLLNLSNAAAKAGAEIEFSITKGVNGAANAVQRLQGLLRDPLGGATAIAGVAGIGAFLKQISSIRGQFQQMEESINTILQSETRGRKLMGELTEFAKVSPLDFKGVVGSAQQMLGFGIDADKIPRFLSAIGDVSMGNRRNFQSLSLAFSQMSAAGKLMGQDLMQMVNAGFQPLNVMAEKTGKSIGQLKEEMSQGKISAEMVQQAFIDATDAGGKYYRMSEKASQTIPGQMSMLEDAFDLLFNDLGKKSEGVIISVIQGATAIVENVDKIAPVLGKAVAAFGIYKAAAMASAFAEKKAQEEKAESIRKGFEDELKKMDEIKARRMELASESSAENVPAFVKGSRYDASKSRDLIDQLLPGRDDASERLSTLGSDYKDYVSRNQKNIGIIDKEIQKAEAELAQDRIALANLENERDVLLQKLDKLRNPDGSYSNQNEATRLTKKIDANENASDNLKALIDTKGQDLGNIRSNRDRLLNDSKARQTQYTKEREELERLVQANKGLNGKEGSDALKKSQLAVFEDAWDSMSADDKASDFGKALHEQIEGLKSDLNGLVNLDSDLKESVDLGFLDKVTAENVQKARNELEDSLPSMKEYADHMQEMADNARAHADELQEEADALLDASETLRSMGDEDGADSLMEDYKNKILEEAAARKEADTLATEANTAAESLNTAQQQANAAAQNANSAATAGNSGATNTNTASKRKNAVVTALSSAGNKAAAITNHLLSSAVNTCKRAVDGLNAAWKSNPLGLIVSGVMAAWAAISAFTGKEDELSESQRKYGEETVKTSNHVNGLYAILEATDKQSKTYKDSLEELKKTATEYGLQIKDEADLYDQLIEKKERLIELILEEGRQKQIAAKVQQYQAKVSTAETDFQKRAAKMFTSQWSDYEDYADAFAMLINRDAVKNAERVKYLTGKIEGIAKSNATSDWMNQQDDSDYRAELEELVFGSARKYAKELGFEFTRISSFTGPLKELTEAYTSNTSKLNLYTAAVRQSREETEKLKDAKPDKNYLAMDAAAIAKDAKETLLSIGKLKQESAKIRIDSSEINGAKNASKKTIESVKELDAQNAAPSADTAELEKVTSKAGEAGDKLDDIANGIIRPKADTEGIDLIITRLNTAIALTYRLNGQTKNGYLTEAERKQLEEVKKRLRFYTNADGIKMAKGTKADIEIYNRLVKTAQDNSRMNIDGKDYDLDEGEAAKWRAYRERNQSGLKFTDNGKPTVDTSGHGDMEKWAKGIKSAKDKEELDRQVEQAQSVWSSQRRGFETKFRDARTNDEFNALKKELNGLMGSVAPNSAEEKWLKSMIETIDTKTGKRKNTYDPKDAQWKRNESERKFYEELKKSAAKREQELEDERIDAMAEGTDKSIAQARNEAKKRRDALLQSEDETARQLMEKDREMWVERTTKRDKDGKVVKQAYAYQFEALQEKATDPDTYTEYRSNLKDGDSYMSEEAYYASMGHSPKTEAFYRKRAEEKLAHAQKMVNIGERETRELNDVYKKQEEDLRSFLATSGTLEQQREAKRADFRKRIAEGEESGNGIEIFKATAESIDFEKDVNAEELFKGLNWEKVFADYDRYSINALEGLKVKLDEVLNDNELEIKFSDKQKILDALDEISRAINTKTKVQKDKNGWGNLFGGDMGMIVNSRKEKSERQKTLDMEAETAKKRLELAKKEEKRAESELKSQQSSILKYVRNQTGDKNLGMNQIKSGNTGNLMKMFQDKNLDTKELASKMGELQGAEQNAAEAAQTAQAAQGASEAASTAAAEGGEGGGGGGGGASAAKTAAIIRLVNDNVQSTRDVLADMHLEDTEFGKGYKDFADSSQSAVNAMESFFKGDFAGVVHHLTQALGSLGKTLGRMGIAGMGESDISLQEDFERLTLVNQELTAAILKLSQDLKEANIKDAEKISKMTESQIRESMTNTQGLMQRFGANYNNGFLGIGGQGSSNKAIDKNMSVYDWQTVSKAAGVNVTNAVGFFRLTSEQMAKVQKQAPEVYAMIKKYAAAGYGDAAQFMDLYIEYWEQLDEIMEATRQRLTSISFDELSSQFRSSLDRMRTDGSKFKEDFADMMKNIIEEDIYGRYEEKLKAWHEKFAKYRAEGSEGGLTLTVSERDALFDEYRRMMKEAEEEYSIMYDLMGIDSLYEQSAKAKTYEGMTQDQAVEMNGRLTAIAATSELIRQTVDAHGASISNIESFAEVITANTTALLPAVASVEEQLAKTAIDIALIQENTAAVVKPILVMSEDMNEIKNKIKNL